MKNHLLVIFFFGMQGISLQADAKVKHQDSLRQGSLSSGAGEGSAGLRL